MIHTRKWISVIFLFVAAHSLLSAAWAQGGGPWTQLVTGGGSFIHTSRSYTEWISMTVHKTALGLVEGQIEYANEGLQGWRYHLNPVCLAISPDGSRAAVIGEVTLSQGQESPPLGTRVAILMQKNGSSKPDTVTVFASSRATCELGLALFDLIIFFNPLSDLTNGNIHIFRR